MATIAEGARLDAPPGPRPAARSSPVVLGSLGGTWLRYLPALHTGSQLRNGSPEPELLGAVVSAQVNDLRSHRESFDPAVLHIPGARSNVVAIFRERQYAALPEPVHERVETAGVGFSSAGSHAFDQQYEAVCGSQ